MAFTAQQEKIMDLFNKRIYSIPRNQRRYVWDEKNWQELFDDVLAVVRGTTTFHFIGSIVLESKPSRDGLRYYSVIDGQQRIITLAIFLSSIMLWMKKKGQDADYRGTVPYVITKDDKDQEHVMVTAEIHGSLEAIINAIYELSKTNAQRRKVNSIVTTNLLSRLDKNIGDAFNFYLNKIDKLCKEERENSQILVLLRNAIRDIQFINITATSEEDSYTIFEILNARGLDLEDHELLKNYIMRYIPPEDDRDIAKTTWMRMEDSLGRTRIKKFIRHYTIHKYGKDNGKRTSDYKIIQENNKRDTKVLLTDLQRKATYYNRLIFPDKKDDDHRNCSEFEYNIFSFLKKRNLDQMHPVLLSLITRKTAGTLTNRLYESTLSFLKNYYVCYIIIGEESPNKLTYPVNKYAAKINQDETEDSIHDFVKELKNILPPVDRFMHTFQAIGWSHSESNYSGDKNKKKVQTVLEAYERSINQGNCIEGFTIEHIKNDCEQVENGIIGNLLPLEEVLNKKCDGKNFEEKLRIYATSSYLTTRKFAERYSEAGTEFDPEKRTYYLAREFYKDILKIELPAHS